MGKGGMMGLAQADLLARIEPYKPKKDVPKYMIKNPCKLCGWYELGSIHQNPQLHGKGPYHHYEGENMSNKISDEKWEEAMIMFCNGASIREVAKKVGIARETAHSIQKETKAAEKELESEEKQKPPLTEQEVKRLSESYELDYIKNLGSFTLRASTKTVKEIKKLLQNYINRQTIKKYRELAKERLEDLSKFSDNHILYPRDTS